jgi:hypothetical protein
MDAIEQQRVVGTAPPIHRRRQGSVYLCPRAMTTVLKIFQAAESASGWRPATLFGYISLVVSRQTACHA